ncbi:MAG TPA: hypothetical protein VKR06_06405 [Ktedonosporobacter sp.]|nr:hypothetical protein [Ktedonosporobacter sp.]
MSYQPGQDPNQPGQYPNSGQYGAGYTPPQPQPQPTDPYSGQQYGQQGGYQPPYGQQQPPYGQQQQYGATTGTTSIGLDQNVASGLSYVLGWVTGLVFILLEKQNREVRFHAMQSIIFFGGLSILTYVVGWIPIIAVLSWPLSVIGFVVWIILLINGFQGKHFKLPVVGDYAERYADQIKI